MCGTAVQRFVRRGLTGCASLERQELGKLGPWFDVVVVDVVVVRRVCFLADRKSQAAWRWVPTFDYQGVQGQMVGAWLLGAAVPTRYLTPAAVATGCASAPDNTAELILTVERPGAAT